MLAALIYIRTQHYPLGPPFDLGILPIPLGQAIGRLGCFARGCCFGDTTDSWLGMYLLNSRDEWAVRYPTQLMSAGIDLLIFLTLVLVERFGLRQASLARDQNAGFGGRLWPFDGFLFFAYVALYTAKRFGMEFLRGDALPPLWGALNLVQILCAIGFLLSVSVILLKTFASVPDRHLPPRSEQDHN
jgi:phosphatidylglycerol:prolipoprotein diacylglycerol transferase